MLIVVGVEGKNREQLGISWSLSFYELLNIWNQESYWKLSLVWLYEAEGETGQGDDKQFVII